MLAREGEGGQTAFTAPREILLPYGLAVLSVALAGLLMHALARLTAVIFDRGHLVGAGGTQRDVTEQKRNTGSQEYRSRIHSSKSSSQ